MAPPGYSPFPDPIQMISDRKLALLMRRLTAEDAVTRRSTASADPKSIETSRRSPELVSVQVTA